MKTMLSTTAPVRDLQLISLIAAIFNANHVTLLHFHTNKIMIAVFCSDPRLSWRLFFVQWTQSTFIKAIISLLRVYSVSDMILFVRKKADENPNESIFCQDWSFRTFPDAVDTRTLLSHWITCFSRQHDFFLTDKKLSVRKKADAVDTRAGRPQLN